MTAAIQDAPALQSQNAPLVKSNSTVAKSTSEPIGGGISRRSVIRRKPITIVQPIK